MSWNTGWETWEQKEPEKPASATLDDSKKLPALANTFLFAEPMEHYLNYSSLVIRDLIATNRQTGQTITELVGVDANASKITETLTTLNPIVFLGIGHGSYTAWSCECTELFMQVGDNKVPLMKDRVVILNSCQTGAQLGPAIMSAGALAYVGSNESFWFYVGDDPNTTRAVKSPFLAEHQFAVSLLQGKTVGEARADHLSKYEEELSYWIEGDGKNHPDGAELARIIGINKGISTFAGEAGTVPSPVGGVATASLSPLSIAVIAGVALAGYFLLKRK